MDKRRIRLLRCLALLILAGPGWHLRADDKERTSGFDEQLLKMVVSIEQMDTATNAHSVGTGFFLSNTNNHLLLVTAKHLVTTESTNLRPNLAIRINERSNASVIVSDASLSAIAGPWFFSSDSDLACRFVTWSEGNDIKVLPLDRLLPIKRVETAAPVLVLGFPMGLRSERYASPITRHGMVARVEEGFLMVEAFIFPGNSGGPVIYTPVLKAGGLLHSPLVNIEMVVGVVTESIQYVDLAVSPQTGRPRVTFEENSGLCHVIPSDKILELVHRSDVIACESRIK